MRLRFDDDQEAEARIKGKKLKPVCGDRVSAEPIPGEADWLITKIHERRNELMRPNRRGDFETLAANLDLVVVVAAASPKPDWFIVDRYLCAAENMGAAAAVVYNKTDLDKNNHSSEILATYRQLGYPCVDCSAKTAVNLGDFADLFKNQTAIIVGQSGVGKSTLINCVAADSEQKTASISRKTGEGRHTTVNSVMISLPGCGAVIDSPGVRDYAPALQSSEQAITGFREVSAFGDGCRFANCIHLREPDCAVKQALEDGEIDPRRYESYKRALALSERLGRERRK